MTDAQTAAQFVFPLLMMGVPAQLPERLNPVELVTTLTGLLAAAIAPYESGQQMPTAPQVLGFQNVLAFIEGYLQRIAQDESMMPFVTQIQEDLGLISNSVKALEQQVMEQQEAMQQNGGMSPEAQAKIVDAGIVAETKGRIAEATAAQKLDQKQQQFVANEARKDAQTSAEIQRKLIMTKVEAVTKPQPEAAAQ